MFMIYLCQSVVDNIAIVYYCLYILHVAITIIHEWLLNLSISYVYNNIGLQIHVKAGIAYWCRYIICSIIL